MTAPAEQFVYMPAAKGRRGYRVVAKSPGVSDDMLAQMETYMLPVGVGRGFSNSKSLLLLRGNLVAYSNITNVGDGYDGRPNALYNHTLILSEQSFANVGFDTRALDAYFSRSHLRGMLPCLSIEGRAPEPQISQECEHLVLPVLRALFAKQRIALSDVEDLSFLPNVLALLPPSMRLVPFSTCLPNPARQPAYRLSTYGGRMRPMPRGFARTERMSGFGDDDLDDALVFLKDLHTSKSISATDVFSEFDKITSSTPRDKIILISKIFGVSLSPEKLRAGKARTALDMLRSFDDETQSFLRPRIEPFLDQDMLHAGIVRDVKLGKKITAKSLERMLDGVPKTNKRRALKAAYGARGPDMEKNACKLLSDMRDSKHAPDVCDFFVAMKSLHPGILEFLSGEGRAPRKHRRRVLSILLPAALKECPELVPEMLACSARDKKSQDDVRDLLKMLAAAAGSDSTTALASAPGKMEDRPGEAPGPARRRSSDPPAADFEGDCGGIRQRLEEIRKDGIDAPVEELCKCVDHGLNASAVVAAWKVLMHVLYKTVEGTGLQDFAHERALQKTDRFSSWSSLNSIGDGEILDACFRMGLYDQNVRKSLDQGRITRNSAAHASERSISDSTRDATIGGILEAIEAVRKKRLAADRALIESLERLDDDDLQRRFQGMPPPLARSCVRLLARRLSSRDAAGRALEMMRICISARPSDRQSLEWAAGRAVLES